MRIGLITAEASGDALARHLLGALQPTEVFGSAGSGVPCESLVDTRLNAVGLGALGQIPTALRLLDRLERALVCRRPDVVVTIDGPSFNLRLARRLRRRGIPVVHWVCPQVWAWRPHRIRRIAASVDALGCLFPFEPGLFRGAGLTTVFTGHPGAAVPLSNRPRATGWAPGSRRGERSRLGPLFRAVSERMGDAQVEALPRGGQPLTEAVSVSGVPAMAAAVDVALCCAGTATLELAVAGVPMVVVYRLGPVSNAVGRRLVRVRQVALPNLLLGREVVPEHLQALDADTLVRQLRELQGPGGDAQREALLEVRSLLRPTRAAATMAELVHHVARNRHSRYVAHGGSA